MTTHNQNVAWVIAANKALAASEKMRRLQAQQATRVIGVVASTNGGSYVLKAVQEEPDTGSDEVKVING